MRWTPPGLPREYRRSTTRHGSRSEKPCAQLKIKSTESSLLNQRHAAKIADNVGNSVSQRPIRRTPAGATVTAATELGSYCRYIHATFAAQTYPEPAIAQLPEERRDLDTLHRQRVVHQAFAVF